MTQKSPVKPGSRNHGPQTAPVSPAVTFRSGSGRLWPSGPVCKGGKKIFFESGPK